jgi:hypothetical protein
MNSENMHGLPSKPTHYKFPLTYTVQPVQSTTDSLQFPMNTRKKTCATTTSVADKICRVTNIKISERGIKPSEHRINQDNI